MKKRAVVTLFLAFGMALLAEPSARGDSKLQPKDVLDKCIATMGGIERLQQVNTLAYQSWSHTFLRSISVSDALPGMFAYETKEVVLQPQRRLVSETSHWQWTESETGNVSTLVISPEGGFVERNGQRAPVSADRFYATVDTLAANPIVALLSASASADVKLSQPPGPVDEISFLQTVYGQPVRTTLGIDKHSYALRWLEIRHSYSQDIYNAPWGDLTKRFEFASWFLDASGLSLPTKWTVSTDGLNDGQVSLVNVKINPTLSQPVPDIPSEFKDSFNTFLHLSADVLAQRNLGNGDHLDVDDGIVMLPGKERAYNSLLVKQDKGIVIVEAPYSNANSEQIIRYAKGVFPNLPILAVISTDYFWFHAAGLGAYARAAVPVFVLDDNVELIQRLLSLQKEGTGTHGPSDQLRIVRGPTQVGAGANRIVLLPFPGTASARMIAVYFPERKLLYCSDLYLPVPWGHQYWTEHISEIRALIEREHLDVRRIAGVSMPPRDWKELAASIPAQSTAK